MLVLLLIFFLMPLLVIWMPARMREYRPLLFAAGQLGAFIYLLLQVPKVVHGASIQENYTWIPQLGIDLGFRLDGLSIIFALLITGIGVLVFLFSQTYMKAYPGRERFSTLLFLFSGSMLGVVLSENLVLMFVFWEFTTFLSFFLISFFYEKALARKAAFQSLFVTFFGGLSLISGIILLGSVTGSYSMHDWLNQSEAIRESRLYLPALILILIGVFTKSAQFPFHFWLQGAMQAPGPVSAYLHSATMVKAGFYLLARLNPVLGGTPEWIYIISMVGVVTMLLGSYMALNQRDIKAILAFTTINALGVLILLMGISTTLSIKAALLFLFVHAFYKAAVFHGGRNARKENRNAGYQVNGRA